MGRDFGGLLAAMIGGYILAAAIAGAAITLSLLYVVPWLWELIRPTIHSMTG